MTNTILALSHNLAFRETPTSLVSRLAARNCCISAVEFCLDMNLDWKKIIRGDACEIDKLASLSDTDRSLLQRYAVRTIGLSRFAIGAERGMISTINRTRTKLCPACISESMEHFGASGVFRCADWQLVSVRTCERHGLWLVSIPKAKYTIDNYDIVRCATRQVSVWKNLFDESQPTILEAYLRHRLDGLKLHRWIDDLPLHIVSRGAEMLGARIEFGPNIRANNLTAHMLHQAGAAGFAVLKGGPAALKSCLGDFFREDSRNGVSQHTKDLGIFLSWLSHSSATKEAGALRRLVREYIVSSYPLDPGRSILGWRVRKPKVLSVAEVSRRVKMRAPRVRELMQRAELESQDTRSGITAEQCDKILHYIQGFATASQAARYLGCGKTQLTQLNKAKHVPLHEMLNGVLRYRWTDLDTFLMPVAGLPVLSDCENRRSLWNTYNYVKCSIADIYELIRMKKLVTACRSAGHPDLSRVLVDPEEVRACLNLAVPSDTDFRTVARDLRTNTKTLHYLAKLGYLRLEKRRHPRTRNMRWYVNQDSLRVFQSRYVTIGVLAASLGRIAGPFATHLDKRGITPAVCAHGVSRIYSLTDVRANEGVRHMDQSRF